MNEHEIKEIIKNFKNKIDLISDKFVDNIVDSHLDIKDASALLFVAFTVVGVDYLTKLLVYGDKDKWDKIIENFVDKAKTGAEEIKTKLNKKESMQ